MKKILLSLAAIPAATMAVEASAQTYGQAYGQSQADTRLQMRVANLEARYNAALQAGVLDRREQSMIGQRLIQLRQMTQQYGYNGISGTERRNLQQQIRYVRDQLRNSGGRGWADRYGWSDSDLEAQAYANTGYGNGYASGNTGVRYDQYGRAYDQYGRPIATGSYQVDQYGRAIPNGGYTVDRYGRTIPNGYTSQGGPYEPVYTPRSSNGGIGNILGGVLGSVVGGGSGVTGVLGSILGNGGLNAGDLITSVLGGALGRANNLGYRDRNDVYFRTDGERVYEIDARTNRVIRVHQGR